MLRPVPGYKMSITGRFTDVVPKCVGGKRRDHIQASIAQSGRAEVRIGEEAALRQSAAQKQPRCLGATPAIRASACHGLGIAVVAIHIAMHFKLTSPDHGDEEIEKRLPDSKLRGKSGMVLCKITSARTLGQILFL
jgi:hypothetical protein